MHTILFGTTNQGKLQEVQKIGRQVGISFEGLGAVSGRESRELPTVVEGMPSYEANAAHKALSYARWAGCACVADDTGLESAALGGLPGLYSHRFGIQRFADLIGARAWSEARFICCISYAEPSGRSISVHGCLEGYIRPPTKEELIFLERDSLPYAYLFRPRGSTLSLRDLHANPQFRSHRGRAVAALARVMDW